MKSSIIIYVTLMAIIIINETGLSNDQKVITHKKLNNPITKRDYLFMSNTLMPFTFIDDLKSSLKIHTEKIINVRYISGYEVSAESLTLIVPFYSSIIEGTYIQINNYSKLCYEMDNKDFGKMELDKYRKVYYVSERDCPKVRKYIDKLDKMKMSLNLFKGLRVDPPAYELQIETGGEIVFISREELPDKWKKWFENIFAYINKCKK